MRETISVIAVMTTLLVGTHTFAQGSVTYDDVIRGAINSGNQTQPNTGSSGTGVDWQTEYDKVRSASPSGYDSKGFREGSEHRVDDLEQYTVDGVIDVNRVPDAGGYQKPVTECSWVEADMSSFVYGTGGIANPSGMRCMCNLELADPSRCQ